MAARKASVSRAAARVHPPGYLLWEVSRDCPMGCGRCRHGSLPVGSSRDLTTDEAVKLIDQAAAITHKLVFTGPEPLTRADLFDLAEYAYTRGLETHLQTNAGRMDAKLARRAVETKIRQIEIFLDGSSGRGHDGFRATPTGFTQAIKGLDMVKLAGIRFRVNTTITTVNAVELPKILGLAQKLGAIGLTVFFNIPVGRGVHFPGDPLGDAEYMQALNWIFDQEQRYPGYVQVQCSPQYERIYKMRAHELPDHLNPFKPGSEKLVPDHGCPAARQFVFVAHDGHVYPCPYLLVSAGHVLETTLKAIWDASTVLSRIRDTGQTTGKCGACKFVSDCRGCRALAFKESADYLAADPLCQYVPDGYSGG